MSEIYVSFFTIRRQGLENLFEHRTNAGCRGIGRDSKTCLLKSNCVIKNISRLHEFNIVKYHNNKIQVLIPSTHNFIEQGITTTKPFCEIVKVMGKFSKLFVWFP